MAGNAENVSIWWRHHGFGLLVCIIIRRSIFYWFLRKCKRDVTPLLSQRIHDAMITLLLRQDDVASSFWRNDDVIIMACAHWDDSHGASVSFALNPLSLTHVSCLIYVLPQSGMYGCDSRGPPAACVAGSSWLTIIPHRAEITLFHQLKDDFLNLFFTYSWLITSPILFTHVFAMTLWYGNAFCVTGPLWGELPITDGFPSQRNS